VARRCEQAKNVGPERDGMKKQRCLRYTHTKWNDERDDAPVPKSHPKRYT